jgi:hypothetical protein
MTSRRSTLILGTQKPPQQVICLRERDVSCAQQDAEAIQVDALLRGSGQRGFA